MLVSQLVYYRTTGSYKMTKKLVVFYEIQQGGLAPKIAFALYADAQNDDIHRINAPRLPEIQVTATQFKEFEKYHKPTR